MGAPSSAKAEMTPSRRGRGRPRSRELETRIKAAALDVLAEFGFSGLTLERICARAGVPKATFYRRWASPTDTVIEAFLEVWREAELKDTGDVAADLEAFAHKLMALYGHPRLGPCMAAVQAERRLNPALLAPLNRAGLERRAKNSELLERELRRLDPPPRLGASLILNVLNGVARNATAIAWPVNDPDLKALVASLLSPA